jgi:hypothetical protein
MLSCCRRAPWTLNYYLASGILPERKFPDHWFLGGTFSSRTSDFIKIKSEFGRPSISKVPHILDCHLKQTYRTEWCEGGSSRCPQILDAFRWMNRPVSLAFGEHYAGDGESLFSPRRP